jgi:hypothetical protein
LGKGWRPQLGRFAMELLTEWWNTVLEYMQRGFGELNWTLPLLIAIWFGYQSSDYQSIPRSALGATLALLFLTILPLRRDEQLKLPDNLITQEFWLGLVAIFVGFVILILFFYAIKRTVLRGGGGH